MSEDAGPPVSGDELLEELASTSLGPPESSINGIHDSEADANDETARPAAPTPSTEPVLRASILVIGSANLDESFHVPYIVRPGETIASFSFSRSTGGKGCNQAIGAARAGAAVKFCGAIGSDGEDIRRAFEADGVQTDYLHVSPDLPTGRALIQVEPRGENSIIITPGANYEPHLPLPDFATIPLVLLQNEIPLERTVSVIQQARRAGTVVIFNPSPLPAREDRNAIPWDMIDYLIVNETEAPGLGFHVCTMPGACVTTFGRRGSQIMLRKSQETVHQSAGVVAKSGVVDTTGAGDCFTSFFAAMLLKLPNPRTPTREERSQLLQIANQAAAMSIEKKGAVYGVPYIYQVKERLASIGAPWPAWAD